MHEHLREIKTGSAKAFSGKFISVRVDNVKLPNGKEAMREVVEHPGAVAIVAIDQEGKVIFVRQHRHAVNKVLLEIPAGKLDPNESPDHCAARELEEETGCQAAELRRLASVYTTPGFTNEIIHIYLATGLMYTAKNTDEDEFLDVESYSPSEIQDMARQGLLEDSKTLLGLYLAGILA